MQRNKIHPANPLTIHTKNLDFPDVGTITELHRDHVIITLSNSRQEQVFAYFSSIEKETISRNSAFRVGMEVHVAVQRDEPLKTYEWKNEKGEIVAMAKLKTVVVQEAQPVYADIGTIFELTDNYAKIKLENGKEGIVIFSSAQKQAMQNLEKALRVNQTVCVYVKASTVHGLELEVKEIGSPEPVTAFLISPMGQRTSYMPVELPSPALNGQTIFSMLKAVNKIPGQVSPVRQANVELPVSDTVKTVTKSRKKLIKYSLLAQSRQENSMLPIIIEGPGKAAEELTREDFILPGVVANDGNELTKVGKLANEAVKLPSISGPTQKWKTLKKYPAAENLSSLVVADGLISPVVLRNDVYGMVEGLIDIYTNNKSITKDEKAVLKRLSFISRLNLDIDSKLERMTVEAVSYAKKIEKKQRPHFCVFSHAVRMSAIDNFYITLAKINPNKMDAQAAKNVSELKKIMQGMPGRNMHNTPVLQSVASRYGK